MIESYGHQTIYKSHETVTNRLEKGPYLATMLDRFGKPKKIPPFAGEGYYFWEDNIDAAEWWGDVRYIQKGKEYRIFRIDLELKYDDGSFLDLVGNRQHLKLLQKLVEKTRKNINCEGWKLHNFMSYFRRMESNRKGTFPFKILRFNDYNLNPKIQNYIQLSDYHNAFPMNPFYIVCVFDLAILNLKSFIFIK
jgi:hypothetical protein